MPSNAYGAPLCRSGIARSASLAKDDTVFNNNTPNINETFLKMEEWKEVFWGCGISERELVVVPSDTSPLAPLNQKLFIIRKE